MKKADFVTVLLIRKFILFIGANLSEERFFPEPLSQDFKFCFFRKGYSE